MYERDPVRLFAPHCRREYDSSLKAGDKSVYWNVFVEHIRGNTLKCLPLAEVRGRIGLETRENVDTTFFFCVLYFYSPVYFAELKSARTACRSMSEGKFLMSRSFYREVYRADDGR